MTANLRERLWNFP